MATRSRYLTATLLIFLAWQTSPGDEDKSKKADIRGSVTQITPADDGAKQRGVVGILRVEGVKEETTKYDKAVISIMAKTTITKMVGKKKQVCTFADIKKGAKVQADFTGPVDDSYPVGAIAQTLLILEDPKDKD
jgi:hypothetical protein